jgi:hypothetical protein
MDNVKLDVKGSILTITIDLSKKGAPSSSGKNVVVASTRGNVAVPGTDAKIGLNVYKPADAK